MLTNCTYCGNEFEPPPSKGRPFSFCSERCRVLAKNDPKRFCTHCKTSFDRRDTPGYINQCSEECRMATLGAKHSRKECDNCGGPCPTGDFCSAGCLDDATEEKPCRVCGNQVPLPTKGPYVRRSKYCSSRCRTAKFHEKSPQYPGRQDKEFIDKLRVASKPLIKLPDRNWAGSLPWTDVNPRRIPDKTLWNPILINSVAFWNYYLTNLANLPTFEHRDLYIAWIGSEGMFMGWTTRCLPLINVLMVLDPEAQKIVTNEVHLWWQIRHRMVKQVSPADEIFLGTLLKDWFTGSIKSKDPAFKKYFLPQHGDGAPKIISMIEEHNAGPHPPPLAWIVDPDLMAILTTDLRERFEKAQAYYKRFAKPGKRPPWPGAVEYVDCQLEENKNRYQTYSAQMLDSFYVKMLRADEAKRRR